MTPSVGILVLKDDQVLLVRHEEASGYEDRVYGLPSGRQQEGELEIDAAVRELKEETGLSTTSTDLIEFPGNFYTAKLPNRKDPSDREIEYSWRVYLCKKYDGELAPSDETSPEWTPLDALSEKKLIVNVQNAIEAGIRYREHKEIKNL